MMKQARLSTLELVLAIVLTAGTAHAQSATADKPASNPAPAQPTPPPGQLEDLDALLGTTKDTEAPKKTDGAADQPAQTPRQASEALERGLREQDVSDDFEQAVAMMGDVSKRLTARNAGLDTQRIQEEILLRLDKLIEQARQNSSNSPKPKGQQQQQSAQRSAQQSQQRPGNQTTRGDNQGQTNNPAGEDARPRTLDPAPAAAWGNLPDHVRQSLVQGLSDRFSSLYQSLTEEYYRRLAEQPRDESPSSPTPAPAPGGPR